MGQVSTEWVDRIPWQIVAISGLLGCLVLVRYIHIQLGG